MSFIALLVGATACKRAKAPDAAVASKPIAAGEDEALVGHAFLRVTGAQAGLLERFGYERLGFALDEHGNYYLGAGERVLVVERGASEPAVRSIELGRKLRLLGIHGDDLILFGDHPARCEAQGNGGRLSKLGTGERCASVFRRARSGDGALELVAPIDTRNALLVGDHVAALASGEGVVALSLVDGELTRTRLPNATSSGSLVAHGDRLAWTAFVASSPVIVESRAPFRAAKIVHQLEGPVTKGGVYSIGWIGESLAYLVNGVGPNTPGEANLYRTTGTEPELLLSGLPISLELVHDNESAWTVSTSPGDAQLWRIGPSEHHAIVSDAAPKLATGTPAGLVWAELHDDTLSVHLAGAAPAGFEAPEVAAARVDGSAQEPADPAPVASKAPSPSIEGTYNLDLAKRIVRANSRDIQACYDASAKQNPELAGVLTIEFEIANSGKVRKRKLVGEPPDAALGRCVSKAFARWRFPKPPDGPVVVTYPLVFPPTQSLDPSRR